MRNCPDCWESEYAQARADVADTIRSGECTPDEWIKALS